MGGPLIAPVDAAARALALMNGLGPSRTARPQITTLEPCNQESAVTTALRAAASRRGHALAGRTDVSRGTRLRRRQHRYEYRELAGSHVGRECLAEELASDRSGRQSAEDELQINGGRPDPQRSRERNRATLRNCGVHGRGRPFLEHGDKPSGPYGDPRPPVFV